MLPADHRLTDPDGFRRATRQGRRAGSRTIVTHLVLSDQSVTRIGFTVSKAVGNAVTRNRVRRRLRHALRDRLATLPADGELVVRANPAAAEASFEDLAGDLDRCLAKVAR